MSEKRLETQSGVFRTWKRLDLATGNRATLRDYLEARGFAVYASEDTKLLRQAALSDFDGEKSA